MRPINPADLSSEVPKIRYSCARQAISLSEGSPEKLYPEIDRIIPLLDSEKRVLVWSALQIIGNLSCVDTQNKIGALIPKLQKCLSDESMITAANAVGALGKIAKNKPQHRDAIVRSLIEVEHATYYSKGKVSPECTKVVIGHVLNALSELGPDSYTGPDVQSFIKRQIRSSRPAVSKLAKELLKG